MNYKKQAQQGESALTDLLRQKEIKLVAMTAKPNQIYIPRTYIAATAENAAWFNNVLDAMKAIGAKHICRTASGGISTARLTDKRFSPPCYDVVCGNRSFELTVIAKCGMARILFGAYESVNGKQVYPGYRGWELFVRTVKEQFCPPLERVKQTKSQGLAAKALIPKPMIGTWGGTQTGKAAIYTNVNHLDLHSAHCAGMAAAHPEYRPAFEYIYKKRKGSEAANKEYKMALTRIWGYAQSAGVGYAYADWSRLGLEWTNKQVRDMTVKLIKSGRKVLLHNTDGIWYQGDVFHDDNEGDGLGQWANDHVGCTLRIKSNGAYEYLENGKYKAVVRGRTKLDSVLPRDNWHWGDIWQDDANLVVAFQWDSTNYRIDCRWITLDDVSGDSKIDNIITEHSDAMEEH